MPSAKMNPKIFEFSPRLAMFNRRGCPETYCTLQNLLPVLKHQELQKVLFY